MTDPIPGLLGAGSRTVVTGEPGAGKTALLGQLAMSAACGIHPFTAERFEPRRVILLDGENHHNLVARRVLKLSDAADAHGAPARQGQLTICALILDLGTPRDRDHLRATFDALEPDLMCVGPFWRFYDGTTEGAQRATNLLDEFASAGCAVVLEAHDPVPDFMRSWPETGISLRATAENHGRVLAAEVEPWRLEHGTAAFPASLARGLEGEWPWTAVTEGAMA